MWKRLDFVRSNKSLKVGTRPTNGRKRHEAEIHFLTIIWGRLAELTTNVVACLLSVQTPASLIAWECICASGTDIWNSRIYCWQLCAGFRATCATIQMTNLSHVLHPLQKRALEAKASTCSPHLSLTENCRHIMKCKIRPKIVPRQTRMGQHSVARWEM